MQYNWYIFQQITLRQGSYEISRVVCFARIGQQIIGQEPSAFRDDFQVTKKFEDCVSGKLFTVELDGERCEVSPKNSIDNGRCPSQNFMTWTHMQFVTVGTLRTVLEHSHILYTGR